MTYLLRNTWCVSYVPPKVYATNLFDSIISSGLTCVKVEPNHYKALKCGHSCKSFCGLPAKVDTTDTF